MSSLRENYGILQIDFPINTGCTSIIRYASAYVVNIGHLEAYIANAAVRRHWSLIRPILTGAGMGYWAWMVPRAECVYTGVSFERLRYAILSDEQRLRMTSLGAHGCKNAA